MPFISHDPDYYYFALTNINERWVLQLANGQDCAIMTTKFSRCMKQISNLSSLDFKAYIPTDEWKERILTYQTLGTAVELDIEINVCGAPQNADAIGASFSKAGIFLQQPRCIPPGYTYFNPQFLNIRPNPTQNWLNTPLLPLKKDDEVSEAPTNEIDLEELFNTVPCPDFLQQVSIDGHISTRLKRYFRPILYF